SFFFFSSRGRHTSCLSDWSSDVCSSDLLPRAFGLKVSEARELLTGDAARHQIVIGAPARHEPRASGLAGQPAFQDDIGVSDAEQIGRASCREKGDVVAGGVAVKTRTCG